jgi:hypothetical protein
MTDPYDWQMARRIARLAAHSDGHGVRRADLNTEIGCTTEEFGQYMRMAYARCWVDCIGDFIVASATDIRAAPRPVSPPTAPEPSPPLRLV